MKKPLFIIIATGLVFCACKRDKNDNPNPNSIDNGTKVSQIPIVEIKDIELYHQTLDTVIYPDLYKFYSISSKAYSNSPYFPFEIAYVVGHTDDDNSKYLIGSASSEIVQDKHKIPSINQTDIEFYRIVNNTGSLLYDTISLSSSIDTIFATNTIKAFTNGKSNTIQSGRDGWSRGYIIGFKLINGKRGLIKLNAEPTGYKLNNGLVMLGNIQFNIKMEK